jgi:hypothetical protein
LSASRDRIRAGEERLKLTVLRHGILVFLAEITSLNQNVDARRKAPVFELVKSYGSRVLLAAENQLLFLFPLGLEAPGRGHSHQQNGHHAQRDEQRRHGIAAISILTR